MYRALEVTKVGKEIETNALGSPFALYRMYIAIESSQEGKEIKTHPLGSP